MIKDLFNLSKLRTQMLFMKAENIANLGWVSALLSMFCFALFLVSYKTMNIASKFLLLSVSAIFFALFIFARRYLFRHIFAELRRRCSEFPSPPPDEEIVKKFARKKKWRILGAILFLIWIPLIFIGENIGLPLIEQDRSDVTTLGWIISIGCAVIGMFIILYGSICPSCKKVIMIDRVTKTCAHCGTYLGKE